MRLLRRSILRNVCIPRYRNAGSIARPPTVCLISSPIITGWSVPALVRIGQARRGGVQPVTMACASVDFYSGCGPDPAFHTTEMLDNIAGFQYNPGMVNRIATGQANPHPQYAGGRFVHALNHPD